MTGKSLDQVRNSTQPPDAPGFANDESQPLSPLMANRWVSQTPPKIKSSFLKIPPCIHNARFSRKILTLADVSQTTAFMGTSGCPCSRKFCEAKNTNPCLRLEPRGRTHSLGQLRSSSTNQLYGSNRLQNTLLQILLVFFSLEDA